MTSLKLLTDGTFGNIYADEHGDIVKKNKEKYCSTFLRELAFSQFYNKPKGVTFEMPYINISYKNLGFPLSKYYGKLSDKDRRFIVNEIIRQVYDLHSNNIYHGDLMSGNILYDGVNVSIIDYGMSSFSINTNRVIYNGWFKAPESVGIARSGLANDIWAIGCIIMMLYSKNLNVIQNIHKHYKSSSFPFCLIITDKLASTLVKMTITDVEKRAKIGDLYNIVFGTQLHKPIQTNWNYFYQKCNDSVETKLYKYLYMTRLGVIDTIVSKISTLKINDIYKFNITNNIMLYLMNYTCSNIDSLINNCIAINYAIFDIDNPKYTTPVELTNLLNRLYPYFITKPNPILGNKQITYSADVYKLCMLAYMIQ